MIQVATFLLPDQQKEANEFLRIYKPAGNINFNRDMLIVFYDNGEHSLTDDIADLQELVTANRKQRFQFEVAIHMMDMERSDLNPKHNKSRWDELTTAISETKKSLIQHDMKREFAENRIKELEAQL